MPDYPSFLRSAFDLHIHAGPDALPRVQNADEVARDARAAGMRGILLKNHALPTTSVAGVLDDPRPGGCRVFGSLTLNPSVGGWNISAVKAALAEGARCIWLPTFGARRHMEVWGTMVAYPLPGNYPGLTVFDDNTGDLRDDVREIIRLVSDANVILATGHLAPDECLAVAREANAAGSRRTVITHPTEEVSDFTIEQQKEAVALGAIIEHCMLVITPRAPGRLTPRQLATQIHTIGAENIILTSDLGQTHNPPVIKGFGIYLQMLIDAGVTEEDLHLMITKNPQRLLDL